MKRRENCYIYVLDINYTRDRNRLAPKYYFLLEVNFDIIISWMGTRKRNS